MATYTDNYALEKPTYAELADVGVLNRNMDKVDDVMHASQVSLAPAYDQNETYNTDDVVMYEMLMYKCLEDNVTGAWDGTKWERTTASECGGGSIDFDIFGEGSGSVVTITDGAEASLVECIVEIEATQSGSGTPSPSNVRPIVGRSEANITVSDGETDNVTTIPLDRTVYGGTLDVTRGILTVDKGYLDLSNLGVTYYKSVHQSGCDRFYSRIADIVTDMDISGYNNALCDYFDIRTYQSEAVGTFYIQTGWINIQVTKDRFATAADFKTWIESESVHIVYELATPQTYTLTPEEVSTILGYNNISADSGDVSVVYVKQTAPIKPNPTGADIPLTGIEIDGEKFKIPQSGTYEETVLYEQPYLTANPNTITLAKDFREFDDIVFWLTKRDDSAYYDYLPTQSIPCELILDAMNGAMSGRPNVLNISGWQPQSQYLRISVSSINQFAIVSNHNNLLIRKITGIKH